MGYAKYRSDNFLQDNGNICILQISLILNFNFHIQTREAFKIASAEFVQPCHYHPLYSTRYEALTADNIITDNGNNFQHFLTHLNQSSTELIKEIPNYLQTYSLALILPLGKKLLLARPGFPC